MLNDGNIMRQNEDPAKEYGDFLYFWPELVDALLELGVIDEGKAARAHADFKEAEDRYYAQQAKFEADYYAGRSRMWRYWHADWSTQFLKEAARD